MRLIVILFFCWALCSRVNGQTLSPAGTATFCVGGSVTLTVNGAPGGSNFQWRKDGSNVGINANTYNANANGNYTVIISPGSNNTPDTLGPVVVSSLPKPNIDFTFTPNNACSGTNVVFTSNASGGTPGYTYAWDFGDAGTSANANPVHAFTSLGCGTGTFNVTLIVTDAKGCTNTVTKQLSVKQAPDVQLSDQNIFSPFSNCSNSPSVANPNYTITVINSSPSAGCISSYNIDWGDGNVQNAVTFPLTHTYTILGAFNLRITGIGTNGCNNTKTYVVANQSNPAGSLGTLGSTTNLCASANVPFTISNWTLNSPGTTYLLAFGDGASITLNHPLNAGLTDDTVNHLYTTTSCPISSYTATLTVVNACDQTPYTAGNIQIRIKPSADFDINTSPSCVGTQVCFNNTTTAGSYGPSCSTLATYSWDFGDGATSNLENACHTYAAAGSYNVTLTSTNPCGSSTKTKQVCITQPPTPGFTLNNNAGCIPFAVSTTNTTNIFNSCQSPTYKWIVTYTPAFCGTASAFTYTNGTSDTSASPSFSFTNPGTYTLTQKVTNACGTFSSSKTVDVKRPPKVAINLPTYSCGVVTITPAATVTNCGTSTATYAWTFAGGTPAAANTANPGAVTFTNVGVHAISLAVTNECGTTTATDNVTVSTAPDVVVPPGQSLCGGFAAGPFNFTSTSGTPTYNWTNSNTAIGLAANGSGSIPAFIATNNGNTPLVATIIVTPAVSSCTGTPDTFTITVNPKPAAPGVVSPLIYCKNEIASALTATGINPLTWYNNASLTGGTAVAPTPVTNAVGTTNYYVTQTNSFGCRSDSAVIAVVVNPGISGNAIAANQTICAGTAPNPITSGTVSGGSGIYLYQWQSSVNGGVSWSNIAGANSNAYAPGILNDTIQYRRVVTSAPCADTSNIVTINVAGALANFDITANDTICEGFAPAALSGQLPTGGGGNYNYVWEKSTDGITWTAAGATTQNYQPPVLNVTTYYRRIVNAAQCSATSNVVTITVNPTPVAAVVAVDASICVYDAGSVNFTATIGTAPFNIELVITKPDASTDTIRQTVNSNGPVSIQVIAVNSAVGNYSIQLIKLTDNKGCTRSNILPAATITVKPLPVLVLTNSSPICNGVSATLTASGATTYAWSPNFHISTTTGATVSVDPPATTTYFVRGTLNGCYKDSSTVVTVIPGADPANAGADQILCNLNTVTLAANIPSVNSSGAWSQVGGPAAVIGNTTQYNSIVIGLAAGRTYLFEWKITGQAPCPPTTSIVKVDVLSHVVNTIKNDTIICNGQSVTITTNVLSGGSSDSIAAAYSYQWESVLQGNSNWLPIAGETNETLSVTPTASTCYRRRVKTNALCEITSNSVCVTVNPTISNNVITASQQVCVNTAVASLQGSIPTGGDNSYAYEWQTSTDSVTWVPVGTLQNFQPLVYTAAGKHFYRRNVGSGNCTATSNVLTVTVNPDSKAVFTGNPVIHCAPFNLSTAITVTHLPDSNGTYNWYADNVLFGSNTTGIFPGYTMNNAGDTVIIKLVTTSQFGCKPDSIQQQFVTVQTAIANFKKDTAGGCSPLIVNFTNTSNLINSSIQFSWDFGNGTTSLLAQPGPVTFLQSPYYNDTTYLVTLKAYNGCNTTIWKDGITVRSSPKARFGVVTTFGCSPFTVKINNTSLGAPNTYYWDFGNGHKDTTTTTGLLNYTYNIGNAVDTFPLRLIAVNECGSDTQTINIRIAPNVIRPQVSINGNDLFGCTPHIVSFNNASTGATRFIWNYGDGTVPDTTNISQSNVLHTFNTPGVFNIEIQMSNGCSDTTIFRQVTVFAKPVAAFTTNAAQYCLGDTIHVNNASQNASNYSWFWGDGQTSTGANPTHVYAVAGSYTILLRAEKTNSSGIVCFDTIIQNITVLVRPDVRIQSNVLTVNCAPFTYTASAPNIINETVTWYVNDTTVLPSIISNNGVSVLYTFNKPGTFSVKMIASNSLGCKDSSIQTLVVRGTPVAGFTPANISICAIDTTVSYLNTTTFNDFGPLTYKWLVDGTQMAITGNFTHHYSTPVNTILPRSFTTQLIATNAVGCSDTAVGILQMNPLPKAQFSINNPNDCVPFNLSISDASSHTNGYQWLLNGVLVDTNANPSILIAQSSTLYTITLIATNIYNCKPDTFNVTFRSRSKPKVSFALSDTLGCSGVLNVATTNNTINATSYNWDWGDGSANSAFRNPTHLYNTPGQYVITLVASDGVCNDTASQVVNVSNKPLADFSVSDSVTCDTAKIQFTNLSQNATSYLWSFSDGTTSNAIDPLKNFAPSAAYYTIKLEAFNSLGCKDVIIKSNLIFAKVPPLADFVINPSSVISIPNYTFVFSNITQDNNNYAYAWNLGDGSFSNSRDVTHQYADTGTYPVRLIVFDNNSGCPDTTIKIARIEGQPGYLYVPNAFYPNSLQTQFRSFKPTGKGLAAYQFQIFDSWGKLLFETSQLDAAGSPVIGWDGNNKEGKPMPQDAYAWRIKATFRNGRQWDGMSYGSRNSSTPGHTFGTVTLFR